MEGGQDGNAFILHSTIGLVCTVKRFSRSFAPSASGVASVFPRLGESLGDGTLPVRLFKFFPYVAAGLCLLWGAESWGVVSDIEVGCTDTFFMPLTKNHTLLNLMTYSMLENTEEKD